MIRALTPHVRVLTEHPALPPVAVSLMSGPWRFQDYFTPDEARAFAADLLAAADEAEVNAAPRVIDHGEQVS